MTIALLGSKNLFSHLQFALQKQKSNRTTLRKGTHAALRDFRWILNNISNHPTRIAEVVPLQTSALGQHDAAKTGAGGVWFSSKTLTPRNPFTNNPVVWCNTQICALAKYLA